MGPISNRRRMSESMPKYGPCEWKKREVRNSIICDETMNDTAIYTSTNSSSSNWERAKYRRIDSSGTRESVFLFILFSFFHRSGALLCICLFAVVTCAAWSVGDGCTMLANISSAATSRMRGQARRVHFLCMGIVNIRSKVYTTEGKWLILTRLRIPIASYSIIIIAWAARRRHDTAAYLRCDSRFFFFF